VVINPKQSPVAEAPIPVEETVSTAPGPENNMEIKKRERESKKQAKREANSCAEPRGNGSKNLRPQVIQQA